MTRRYFGTDGIRGRVGQYPMTPDFVLHLGWAAGRILAPEGGARVVIGKDTRISGYMLESALESGLSAAGVDTLLLGPMPTPGIAYLTRAFRAAAGVVVSASHNPYYDNGVKFFGPDGNKLADATEFAIEAALDEKLSTRPSRELGKAERIVDARGRYVEYCKRSLPLNLGLQGLRLVLDCANGATYAVAPSVFRELGAEVIERGAQPDGLNINDACGATAPQGLAEAVQATGADAGIAVDGDGDRVIMVDHRGEIVDGDELLYIIVSGRHHHGYAVPGVVGTLMSNLGLEEALQRLEIPFERTRVGDRYVLERLLANDWLFGGETSGHIICREQATTGDGIISALQVLSQMVLQARPLHELKQGMDKHPQVLINVPTQRRISLNQEPAIQSAVSLAEQLLQGVGRVLVRPSGTEPLLRVMVEGRDKGLVDRVAEDLVSEVRQAIGSGA